jgi:hypothetical protein
MTKRGSLFCCLLILLVSCSQSEKDKGIKEMIATNAKKEVAFAGVNFTVSNGVVTLTGNCPSEKDKSKVEETVQNTNGVKQIINQIVVAPVVLTNDHPLQQSVDSVLMKYPTVTGNVKDSVILIQGNIGSKKAQKLIKALQSLKAKGLTNEMVINNENE